MSFSSPHSILTTAGSNPYEVAKAKVQLQLLISQYRSAKQTRHWSPSNPQGLCTYPQCYEISSTESTEHILLHCPAYASTRQRLIQLGTAIRCTASKSLIISCLLSHSLKNIMQLLLDCSALPAVIAAAQLNGEEVYKNLFYYGRTWCFAIHRERKKRLCQWNRILSSSHHSLVLGLGRYTDNFLSGNALTNNVVSMFINHNIGCSCEINKNKATTDS